MGKSRVITPTTRKIDLSEGDWIIVKEQLNTGEQKDLENCGLMPPMIADGRVVQPVDWRRHDLERALIFITDWSLFKEDNQRMPLDLDSLRSLDPLFFEEINTAIVNHVMEVAARKKQKRDARKAKAEQTPNSLPSTSVEGDAPTSM